MVSLLPAFQETGVGPLFDIGSLRSFVYHHLFNNTRPYHPRVVFFAMRCRIQASSIFTYPSDIFNLHLAVTRANCYRQYTRDLSIVFCIYQTFRPFLRSRRERLAFLRVTPGYLFVRIIRMRHVAFTFQRFVVLSRSFYFKPFLWGFVRVWTLISGVFFFFLTFLI